jgi:tripartite-type tricarboxylate transporter receptor subunit TctC
MKPAIRVLIFFVLFILCLSQILSAAADYPSRPVTLIVPMAPGGSRDILARSFASAAEKFLGQPVVVVNKPGATGMIGLQAGAQAAPDGYTLTSTSTSDTCAIEWEIANGRKPVVTPKQFVAIASLNMSPSLIIVPYDSPWKKLADLIHDIQAKPGYYAFCSGGLYGVSHMPAEIFARALGLKLRHVPYAGGGPCINAVVGKHVDFSAQFPSSSTHLAKGNKLRILAVQGDHRLRSIPDVPTVKELGIDAQWHQWVGVSAPLKTPAPIVQKLREVAKKVVEDKSYIQVVENLGDEVHYLIGDEMMKYWEAETEKVRGIMTDLAKEPPKK